MMYDVCTYVLAPRHTTLTTKPNNPLCSHPIHPRNMMACTYISRVCARRTPPRRPPRLWRPRQRRPLPRSLRRPPSSKLAASPPNRAALTVCSCRSFTHMRVLCSVYHAYVCTCLIFLSSFLFVGRRWSSGLRVARARG